MATATNDVKVRLAKVVEAKGKKLAAGTVVKIGDIIGEDGTWNIERKGKVVGTAILHRAVQQLAEVTGITVLEEKILSFPSLENRMHTMWQYEVELAVLDDTGKPTGEVRVAKEIGVGTSDDMAGTEYMARKRAFDRAVLDVLGLYDVYSDIETEQFKEKSSEPSLKLEELDAKQRTTVNAFVTEINGTRSVDDLRMVGDTLAQRIADTDASKEAVAVIRHLYKTKMESLKEAESIKDEGIV